MLTKISLLLGVGFCSLIATFLPIQDEDATQAPSKAAGFMQRKLDFTRTVVDGLATEDYEKISAGAQDLLVLSHEADWNVITSQEYLKMSAEFRKSTERLLQQGEQKNLDGATLAYFEVTLNCIRCHRQVRQGFADGEPK